MLDRVLSPVLVGRQDELSELEDALLSVNRGDGRFVLLAGEAGIGKTRLATELSKRARKLGCDVLWGSCSDAELVLPFLPFVEAVGNHLGERDPAVVRTELGPAADELAQLFPQLATGPATAPAGDPAQAKLRLFESVVTLLELWARDRGLLLVLDDIHWADGSTRELLDYAARRLVRSRVMLFATYRSDEVDRRHPLTRTVQTWRRSGLAETVTVSAMTQRNVIEMIAAILNADDVSAELAKFVDARAEGNPFVLEEMLREALDRGEILQTQTGWARRSAKAFRLPETVREAVLLRLGRLDSEQVEVLRAAAVLGRTFDYGLLVDVAGLDERLVLDALESAVAQQLLDEGAEAGDRYSWRHALTQEAIASDTVMPKRQRIHSLAADALIDNDGSAVAVAGHLLGAGRTDEAVVACVRAADEAERAVAFREASHLLERVLPHVSDPREQALLLYRMGHLRWMNGEPAAAEQLLADSVEQLDALALTREAARARVYLGRCRWELDQPEEAAQDYERAREALEEEGPTPELALVYLRIAGIHAFELDYMQCRVAAERAVEIAEQASAEFERVWAFAHVALGHYGTLREFDLLDRAYEEALAKGYTFIAANVLFNEIWDRVHTLTGGLDDAVTKVERIAAELWNWAGGTIAMSLAMLALGRPRDALHHARSAIERHESLGASKFAWRSHLAAAEALLELGRVAEAVDELPALSPGNERQDIVYDTATRVGVARALGRTEEAVELARRASADDAVLAFGETAAVAVEAFVAGGLLEEAEAVLRRTERVRVDLGRAGLEISEGTILLAQGNAAEARTHLDRAQHDFEDAGLQLWAWRAAALAAEAAAQTGDRDAATELFATCMHSAHVAGAFRVRDDARVRAARLGLDAPSFADEPANEIAEPDVVPAGERLVTSMFADVRGYTPLTSAIAPEELADRITTLYRWAATEVGRRYGIVDKFAGDAVMATFNAAGARVDHAVLALEAALALRDKAAIMDLPVGIGIAVGPAVVTRSGGEANVSVLGEATNLAARLQTAAAGGEILLSGEAFRRVAAWLDERGLPVEPEELELKGFEGMQRAYRLRAAVASAR
ncbi:MAG TPA: AAA family ATPase [Gaiellaceae bacterium]